MSAQSLTTEERFATIVAAFLNNPDVTPPVGTGFGSSGLRLGGKIFAMLSSRGEFVVKLPQQRVNALIASGDGQRFDPGHGRLMKEWLTVAPASHVAWLSLAQEALEFVSSKP